MIGSSASTSTSQTLLLILALSYVMTALSMSHLDASCSKMTRGKAARKCVSKQNMEETLQAIQEEDGQPSSPAPVELKGQAYLEATHGSQWRSVAFDLLSEYQKCLQLSSDQLGFHILTYVDADLENALLRGSQKQRNEAAYDIFNLASTMRENKRVSKLKDGKEDIMLLLRQMYGI